MSFTDDNEKDCGEDITDDESEKVITTLMIVLASSIAYTLPFT